MQKLFSPLVIEFKRGSVTDEGQFTGYAATFGPPADSVNDIIEPGAFADSLREHKSASTVPGLLWSHSLDEPIGKWLSFVEDSHGLLARGKLTLETRRGREALALLKDDACSLSIGFTIPTGGSYRKGEIRHITKASLLEVSIVSIPANARAKITNVRKPDSIRDFQTALRGMGFSNRESKFVTTHGFRDLLAPGERSPIDLLSEKVDHLQRTIEAKL